MGIGFTLGILGVLVLAHAAYSTIQYRENLKITEEEISGPPIDVVVELVLGLVVCVWAALTVPGKFLSIHPDSDENSSQQSRSSASNPTTPTPLLNFIEFISATSANIGKHLVQYVHVSAH